jgi:hypothetical protein
MGKDISAIAFLSCIQNVYNTGFKQLFNVWLYVISYILKMWNMVSDMFKNIMYLILYNDYTFFGRTWLFVWH